MQITEYPAAIGRDTALMVGYFGSKGTHLEIDRNINQLLNFGVANLLVHPMFPFLRCPRPAPRNLSPNVHLGTITERGELELELQRTMGNNE